MVTEKCVKHVDMILEALLDGHDALVNTQNEQRYVTNFSKDLIRARDEGVITYDEFNAAQKALRDVLMDREKSTSFYSAISELLYRKMVECECHRRPISEGK